MTFANSYKSDQVRMSGLTWIQTVWHSDGIPESIFEKIYFEKNQQTTKRACKITQKAKS